MVSCTSRGMSTRQFLKREEISCEGGSMGFSANILYIYCV